MKNVLKSFWQWTGYHKILVVFLIIVIGGGGYYGYNKLFGNKTETRYVLAAVQRGTLVVSVSATGQVSASNQVDIKPKVSGDIISIKVQEGQEVRRDMLIAQIDAQDAQKAVRDAQINLDNAKLQLDILKQSSANLDKLYSDGFTSVVNAFLDLPNIMTALENIIFDTSIGAYENLVRYEDRRLVTPLEKASQNAYTDALAHYNNNFAAYQTASRYNSSSQQKLPSDY